MNTFDIQELNKCHQELINISRNGNSSNLQSEMLKKEALKSPLYAYAALSDWVIIEVIIQHPYGIEWIKKIACSCSETGVSFFHNERLIELVASHPHGIEWIKNIALSSSEGANAFLFKEVWVGKMRKGHLYGEEWINKIIETALTNLQLFKLHMKQQLIEEGQLTNMVFLEVVNSNNRARIEPIIADIEKLKMRVDCNLSLKRLSQDARKQFFFAPDHNFLNIIDIIFSAKTISKNEGCMLLQLPAEIINSILETTISPLDNSSYLSASVIENNFSQDRSRLSL